MNSTTNNNLKVWREIAIKSKGISDYLVPAFREFVKRENKSRKSVALMNLMRRVHSNLKAVYYLSAISLRSRIHRYFKFPAGILVRSCLMDCITGLYLLKSDEARCGGLLDVWNRDYVKAMFEEFEVYKDKADFREFQDDFIEHVYTMAMEDAFLEYLDANEDAGETEPMKERFMWKARDPKDIYSEYKRTDGQLKSMKDEISEDASLGSCMNCLYAYYKYFSQYEHFSELSNGDSLVDFGDDNVRFEKVFDHIEDAVFCLCAGFCLP